MKVLRKVDIATVSGGEIIPGNPSPNMTIINLKLMIAAGRGQPGFDVGTAAYALTKVDPIDFWNPDVALEYVRTGNIPMPG